MRRLAWLLLALIPLSAAADEQAWATLRQGQALLLIRHAHAPGLGDPPGFTLGDCTTQRNLDVRGQAQARRWGERLRRQGIGTARVFSSRWCRALDTARLMRLGEVTPLPALDSFFQHPAREAAQTRALREALATLGEGPPVVLVTHQVNITALTGIFPRSGEGLIVALPLAEPPRLLARLPAP